MEDKMTECDFKYNNHWLSEFDMIMCDPDTVQSFVSREIDKGSQTSSRAIPNFYSVRYSDVLSLEFLIIKNELLNSDQKNMILSSYEINEIRSWLESPKSPCELFVKGDSNDIDTRYFGLVTASSPFMVGEECYGLKFTFTCNAPYGFLNPKIEAVDIQGISGKYKCEFYNASAERCEYLYPKITIEAKSGGFLSGDTLKFTNLSDGSRDLTLVFGDNISGTDLITLDCYKKIIKNGNNKLIPLSDLGISFGSDYFNGISANIKNIYWPRLLYGNNLLEFEVSRTDSTVTDSSNNSIMRVTIAATFIAKGGGF